MDLGINNARHEQFPLGIDFFLALPGNLGGKRADPTPITGEIAFHEGSVGQSDRRAPDDKFVHIRIFRLKSPVSLPLEL